MQTLPVYEVGRLQARVFISMMLKHISCNAYVAEAAERKLLLVIKAFGRAVAEPHADNVLLSHRTVGSCWR